MGYENIPEELRNRPQWVCWRYEDHGGPKPTKVPYNPRTGGLASVSDALTWSSFLECYHAVSAYDGIGFVFTDADEYSFIDLDDTEGDQTAYARQLDIYSSFGSYSEISPSGTGLHIIVRGKIPSGRKRSKIEVYSSGRYGTFTGNVYANRTVIEERQQLLTLLWEQIGGTVNNPNIYSGDQAERFTDAEIIEKASSAVNGDNFKALLHGEWNTTYPSQSEADLSFVNMLAFYTQHRGQIARIFRSSALGQRAKAQRHDYVNWMINKGFDRILPPLDFDGLRNQIEEKISRQHAEEAAAVAKAEAFAQAPMTLNTTNSVFPPGLVGQLANFMFQASARPAEPIALAGAIALLAGIVGRSFNISGTGLNQYVILLAETGTGKESMGIGIDRIMGSLKAQVPACTTFMGPGKINSAPALLKHLNKKSQCFVSVLGEFGHTLQEMCSPQANPLQISLRGLLLGLWSKSGAGQMVHPSIYSDSDMTTDIIHSPNVTLLGETTPSEFFKAIDEGTIAAGLLPRFLHVEYDGIRVRMNKNHNAVLPSFDLMEQMGAITEYCLKMASANKVSNVAMTEDAEALLDQYDLFADTQINSSDKDVLKHMWNRAHLKALKLSALVAVGVNPYNPIVDWHIANWAINLVDRDITTMIKRFELGIVGRETDETRQQIDMYKAFSVYLTQPYSEISKYSAHPSMHNDRVIPMQYIQRRLVAQASFRKDKTGATNSIKRTVQVMVDAGDIQEVPKGDMIQKYGFSGRAYMLKNTDILRKAGNVHK